MTTKQALSEAMSCAAGSLGTARVLASLAEAMDSAEFERITGMSVLSAKKNIAWRASHYQQVRAAYENHCREINEPAYLVWSGDYGE